jgi:hypothetical protein
MLIAQLVAQSWLMQLEQKHLSVTVVQDNLELRAQQGPLVRQAQRVLEEQLEQLEQLEQQAVVAVAVEHDLVLVHLVSAHVMMLLK